MISLIDLGYADQITLGNDFSSKLLGRSSGNYGCTRFAEFALPMLKKHGYEAAIQKLVVDNPRRILEY